MNRLPINRILLKLEAKTRIMRARPSAILMGMIAMAAFLVIQMLILGVLGLSNVQFEIPETVTTYDAYVTAMEQLQEQIYTFVENYRPALTSVIIAAALTLMREMVSVGFSIYALHISREEKAEIGNLMDGFPIFGRVIVLLILRTVIVSLLMMLFVIPGVIVSYRYRQALYLLVERPDLSPAGCLRESGRLMRGRKMELFVLDLSFFGWYLAQIIPLVGSILAIWVLPYTQITYAGYYCHIAGPRTSSDGKPYTDAEFTDLPDT